MSKIEPVIGIYGGTFNPVHLAHLNLAIQMKELHHLDEVWFIPVHQHPFQKQSALVSIDLRIKMVEIALQPYPFLKICTFEAERTGPSYTIDTLREIHKLYPKSSLHLILGEDALQNFDQWKEPEEILRLAPPLIGKRAHQELCLPHFSEFISSCLENGKTTTLHLEISSSLIRDRLVAKLECRHLLSPKVFEFIEQNRLYSRESYN